MSNTDPFEAFKNRREIELIEDRFKEAAESQRKRVDDALADGDEEAVVNEKINQEMEDFFKESTDSVEKVLEEISGPVAGEDIEVALKRVAQAAAAAEGDSGESPKSLDLRAALDRIRRHRDTAAMGHGDAEEPQTAPSELEPEPGPELESGAESVLPGPLIEGSDFDFDFDPEPAPSAPKPFKVLQTGEESFPELEPEVSEAAGDPVEPEPEESTEIEPACCEPALDLQEDESSASGAPEPDLEIPVEPEAPPTLDELAGEVRRLKKLLQVLLDKGVVTPEELEV